MDVEGAQEVCVVKPAWRETALEDLIGPSVFKTQEKIVVGTVSDLPGPVLPSRQVANVSRINARIELSVGPVCGEHWRGRTECSADYGSGDSDRILTNIVGRVKINAGLPDYGGGPITLLRARRPRQGSR